MSAENKYVDIARIEKAVGEILLAVGENPKREGLEETPKRVANMYAELLAGMHEDPQEHVTSVFHERYDEIVLLRDVPFYSVCEHHMMPFIGKIHIAYLPDGKVLGVSKLARIVDCFARRLQVQERLTTQVADIMMKKLRPLGVLVVIEAEHLCMSMRGVRKPGVITVTSAVRGIFKQNQKTRMEAFSLIKTKA